MEFVLLKSKSRSVNTFIPLGDETINSRLVERGRSLMDPQPHPVLHFLVQMKPTSTNVFLQVAETVEVTREQIWAVRTMLKCFPTKSPKLIPRQIDSMGRGVIMQKDDSVRQHSRAFWLYGASQHLQLPRNELHLSALLYTTLTSRSIKKQLCGPVCFHYECLLSYRWQYRYATTVLPAFKQMKLKEINEKHIYK